MRTVEHIIENLKIDVLKLRVRVTDLLVIYRKELNSSQRAELMDMRDKLNGILQDD